MATPELPELWGDIRSEYEDDDDVDDIDIINRNPDVPQPLGIEFPDLGLDELSSDADSLCERIFGVYKKQQTMTCEQLISWMKSCGIEYAKHNGVCLYHMLKNQSPHCYQMMHLIQSLFVTHINTSKFFDDSIIMKFDFNNKIILKIIYIDCKTIVYLCRFNIDTNQINGINILSSIDLLIKSTFRYDDENIMFNIFGHMLSVPHATKPKKYVDVRLKKQSSTVH
jgi:hypothetical protein